MVCAYYKSFLFQLFNYSENRMIISPNENQNRKTNEQKNYNYIKMKQQVNSTFDSMKYKLPVTSTLTINEKSTKTQNIN